MVSSSAWARGTIVSIAAPFVVAAGVPADRARPAQGRGAERRSEPVVGRAACRLARDLEAETDGRAAVEFEECAARLVLCERSAA